MAQQQGLPFIPPGFQPLGPSRTTGAILSVEHTSACPLSGTTFTLPSIDLSVFDLATDRKQVRNLINALASENGCNCGIDIPNTQILISRINNSGAPAEAVPFILNSTSPWSSYNPTQSVTERMDGIDHGGLENSRHAPRASPRQTQLPEPQMDSPSPTLNPAQAAPVPAIFIRFNTRTSSLVPKIKSPVPFNPRTINTANQASQHQGAEDLMAHINALITKTSGQVSILSGRMGKLFEVTDSGFGNNDILFKEQSRMIERLTKQVSELKQIVNDLQKKPQIAPRNPVALPNRPPAPTAIDKGKGRAPPPDSPIPAPAPTQTTTRRKEVVNIRDLPSQGRAPPEIPTASSGTETAPEQRRPNRSTHNPAANYVAPKPGNDDPEEEESDSGNLSEALNWADTARMRKGDKWTMVTKKVTTPVPTNHRRPEARKHRPAPPHTEGNSG